MWKFLIIIFFSITAAAAIADSCDLILDNSDAIDSTREVGSTGEDIVDACIRKITSISLLSDFLNNDFGFMKRIALVETNFGTETGSITDGGIWQITPVIIEYLNIETSIEFTNMTKILSEILQLNLRNFSTIDYNIPIYSAVAARLYMEVKREFLEETKFPGTVNEQSDWWLRYFHSRSSEKQFNSIVEAFENVNSCTVSKLDLWFLIDGSGSIGLLNFQKSLDFVNETASSFMISPDRVRVGLMLYNKYSSAKSYLNEHQSKEEFSTLVKSLKYPGGGTSTGDAIERIVREGFTENNGARPLNEAVPRILVVLTDGRSSDSVERPSKMVKELDVTVFAVGVGSSFDRKELQEIASEPSADFVYEISQFEDLISILRNRIPMQACSISAAVPSNTTIFTSVLPESTLYSKVEIPANGSVGLQYEVTETGNSGIAYLSETISNPNAAIHDASFQIGFGTTCVLYNSAERNNGNEMGVLYISVETNGNDEFNLTFFALPNAQRVEKKEVLELNSTISTPVPSESGLYSKVEIPANGSIALIYKMEESNSDGIVHLSKNTSTNNAVYQDASFKIAFKTTLVINNSTNMANEEGITDDSNEMRVLYFSFQNIGHDKIKLLFSALPNVEETVKTEELEGSPCGCESLKVTGMIFMTCFSILYLLFENYFSC